MPETDEERKKRIKDLKDRAEELCGGQMETGGLEDCPAETEEAFWKHLVDYEEAPWTTHFAQLESAGVSLGASGFEPPLTLLVPNQPL